MPQVDNNAPRLPEQQNGAIEDRPIERERNVSAYALYGRLVRAKISSGAFRLWHYLRDFIDQDGRCWPGQRLMVKELRCDAKSLKGWTQQLVEAKYLAIVGRKEHGTYHYQLLDGTGAVMVKPPSLNSDGETHNATQFSDGPFPEQRWRFSASSDGETHNESKPNEVNPRSKRERFAPPTKGKVICLALAKGISEDDAEMFYLTQVKYEWRDIKSRQGLDAALDIWKLRGEQWEAKHATAPTGTVFLSQQIKSTEALIVELEAKLKTIPPPYPYDDANPEHVAIRDKRAALKAEEEALKAKRAELNRQALYVPVYVPA
jgi:hypothetical protein